MPNRQFNPLAGTFLEPIGDPVNYFGGLDDRTLAQAQGAAMEAGDEPQVELIRMLRRSKERPQDMPGQDIDPELLGRQRRAQPRGGGLMEPVRRVRDTRELLLDALRTRPQ